MLSPLSKELIKHLEAEIRCHASQHADDPEISFAPVLSVLRAWTLEFPRVQVTVEFSKPPTFAVRYVYNPGARTGHEWTRYIRIKSGPKEFLEYGGTRYDNLKTLAQELLRPLLDANFRPPET
jgi:hypothetical protein